ncbi:MAG: MBL fold metallo-hydrolase [Pseudoxanthomonas suwonensis]|nr:MBL fold metallo-hydrolase [Pseudoxanthomonas suwonensis]
MASELHIEPFFHEDTGTWTYVVHRDGDAVVIDPVLDYDPASGRIDDASVRAVTTYIVDNGLRLLRILETHAHADHLSGAQLLRDGGEVPVGIGAGIRKVQAHFAALFGIAADAPVLQGAFEQLFQDGQQIPAGALTFTACATPGHTSDSLTYVIEDNAFVGDTLFAPDVGTARCDFPGGSIEALYASIQRLYALPDDTRLWLCHDYPPAGRERRASVSVGESKRYNRMLDGETALDAFATKRRERDAKLAAPRLLYPALQVNIRGGRLPRPHDNGRRYLTTPLNIEVEVPEALD